MGVQGSYGAPEPLQRFTRLAGNDRNLRAKHGREKTGTAEEEPRFAEK
jgi:hypothetical protein